MNNPEKLVTLGTQDEYKENKRHSAIVKNHDFKPKNHIFSNFREGARRVQRALLWIRPCEGTPIESPIFVSY
jgi:hypothetical protein